MNYGVWDMLKYDCIISQQILEYLCRNIRKWYGIKQTRFGKLFRKIAVERWIISICHSKMRRSNMMLITRKLSWYIWIAIYNQLANYRALMLISHTSTAMPNEEHRSKVNFTKYTPYFAIVVQLWGHLLCLCVPTRSFHFALIVLHVCYTLFTQCNIIVIELAPSSTWPWLTSFMSLLRLMTDFIPILLLLICMMTSSNGKIFRVTGPLCVEFTGHRRIPHTKSSDTEFWCFRWSVPEKKIE